MVCQWGFPASWLYWQAAWGAARADHLSRCRSHWHSGKVQPLSSSSSTIASAATTVPIVVQNPLVRKCNRHTFKVLRRYQASFHPSRSSTLPVTTKIV